MEFLVTQIHKYQPTLDDYAPLFDKEVNALLSELPAECTPTQYLTYVTKICALSREGHFAVGNWSDTVHRGIPNDSYQYLPLVVRIIDSRVFVWYDVSNEGSFERGDELLAINGKPISHILEELYDCTPHDGEIRSYTEKTIAIGFPWLYYFHIEQSETFEISYLSARKGESVAVIGALRKSEQVQVFTDRITKREGPKDDIFAFDIDGTRALWKLGSFSRSDAESFGIDPKKYYKERFGDIADAQVDRLVIDLRGNMGGLNEFADELVPYILKNEPDSSWLKASESWEGKKKNYRMPKRSKLAYDGQIWVLVDGRTFSNGSTLARYLKEFGGAVLIGEETGSRYEGYAAGSKQYVTLPHSKMPVGIPRYHIYYPPGEKQRTKDRGVIPDHYVKTSIEDLLEERDAAVEKLLQLMN